MNAETRAKKIGMTPDDLAEGICAALARAEAAFDKRGWVEMPKADRNRYVERALLAKPLITQAIRQAQNDKLEEAAQVADAMKLGGDEPYELMSDDVAEAIATTIRALKKD